MLVSGSLSLGGPFSEGIMAPKMFQTQHKPQREEVSRREMADVKRENHLLKKQIGRLRKQLAKMVEKHGLEIPEVEEPLTGECEIPIVELEKNLNVCERCGAEAKEFSVGGKFFIACLAKCGWKKLVGGKE